MTKTAPVIGSVAICLALFAQGCSVKPEVQAVNPASVPERIETIIGLSVEQRPIKAHVFGHGETTALFLGSIHGSEPAGAVLCDQLITRLEPKHYRGRHVVVVPRGNPDGLLANRRTNMRGVDLNRNFPADNYRSTETHGGRPLSEPERQALHKLVLQCRPIVVVSIHQPLALVDYDGPTETLAARLGKLVNLPVRRLGGMPGSMGSWVGNDLGIPIITLELPRHVSRWDGESLWDAYGPAMLVLISEAAKSLQAENAHSDTLIR